MQLQLGLHDWAAHLTGIWALGTVTTCGTLMEEAGAGPHMEGPSSIAKMGKQPVLTEYLLYHPGTGYPYIRVYFPNRLEGRAVTTPLYPSAVSRSGQELQEHLQDKKDFNPLPGG